MNKYEITKKIEKFAPLETQEKWDCSGWLVETSCSDIQKIMLCLTVTDDIVRQARVQNCDMIISHHPLFKIDCHSELVSESLRPLINIYCAHTNLDKVNGGTTDTLVDTVIASEQSERRNLINEITTSNAVHSPRNDNFVRYVDVEISLQNFLEKLKTISPNLRYVNNRGTKMLKRIAFCAGSGSEFIKEAFENGADAFVTGDLKFHAAVESPVVVFDIGHFESEILVLPVFEKIIGSDVQFVYADEKSPFINLDK